MKEGIKTACATTVSILMVISFGSFITLVEAVGKKDLECFLCSINDKCADGKHGHGKVTNCAKAFEKRARGIVNGTGDVLPLFPGIAGSDNSSAFQFPYNQFDYQCGRFESKGTVLRSCVFDYEKGDVCPKNYTKCSYCHTDGCNGSIQLGQMSIGLILLSTWIHCIFSL